ncbi:MAG: OmpH family outer membrane protein, partial [Bacteroidales bacterium]|nr:OmpH family outer membrane protein [Bacteroidales bacterium]
MNENEPVINEMLNPEEGNIATPEQCKTEDNQRCRCRKRHCICKIVLYALFAIAVIVLYILHFTSGNCKKTATSPFVPGSIPNSGEIVYINIDSINSHYALVEILQADIDAEKARQEAIFQNRQKSLENKYAIFQRNYQSNQLTPVQIENTQQQLVAEGQQLQTEYEMVMQSLSDRQLTALKQISDSLTNAAHRINASRNASFIFMYQTGGQLLVAD